MKNVWFISVTFTGAIMRLEKTGFRSTVYEITGGAGNINPLNPGARAGAGKRTNPVVFPPSQFLYAGGEFPGTTFTFDPKNDTVRVVFQDPKMGDAMTCDQTPEVRHVTPSPAERGEGRVRPNLSAPAPNVQVWFCTRRPAPPKHEHRATR